MPEMTPRTARIARKTRETEVTVELDLDGSGMVTVDTGVGFFDHLLTALVFHARFNLTLRCTGDLVIDDHHSVEDCALSLGTAFNAALGDRRGIRRFGSAYAPLDEALARAVIDCSGRPFARSALQLQRESIGNLATENIGHALASFAMKAGITLHVDVLAGENDHHRAEAAFKAVALALREAVTRNNEVLIPSTKGVL